MNPEQTRSLLTVCLMAAFSDGHQDPREREHVRQVGESLSSAAGADFMRLYQDVLLKRVTLEQAVAGLDTPDVRQLAFEMAVGVCDADGVHDADETAFLERLAALLGLSRAAEAKVVREADELAEAPVREAIPEMPSAVAADQPELDRMILNAAILNGALELLPETLASMAIIPLQTRLVYRIGKAHGYELDRGHIKDFLATIGVGLTSQYVEQFGRKLIGGMLGKMLGRAGRTVASEATGAAFSFATTYALGHVAKRYYAGGRTLDASALKASFEQTVDSARSLQSRYAPQIAERARTLDLKKLVSELRVG